MSHQTQRAAGVTGASQASSTISSGSDSRAIGRREFLSGSVGKYLDIEAANS